MAKRPRGFLVREVPYHQRTVEAAGGDGVPVIGTDDEAAPYTPRMATEVPRLPIAGQIHSQYLSVERPAGADRVLAVVGDSHGRDRALVTAERLVDPLAAELPQPHRAIGVPTDKPLTVGREGDQPDGAADPSQDVGRLVVVEIPYPKGAAEVTRDHVPAVRAHGDGADDALEPGGFGLPGWAVERPNADDAIPAGDKPSVRRQIRRGYMVAPSVCAHQLRRHQPQRGGGHQLRARMRRDAMLPGLRMAPIGSELDRGQAQLATA